MNLFGLDGYGDKESFTIKCCKCGKEGDIVPIHQYGDGLVLEKIILERRCKCGNKYGATIHDKRKLLDDDF